MNTINLTTKVFHNTFIQQNGLENFQKVIIRIKNKANKQGLSSEEHILYNLIRGLAIDRGFVTPQTPVTEGYLSAKATLIYYLNYDTKKLMFEDISPVTMGEYMAQLKEINP